MRLVGTKQDDYIGAHVQVNRLVHLPEAQNTGTLCPSCQLPKNVDHTMTDHDFHTLHDEAAHHLQQLLRIDTTNPPGNELAAAEYLAGVMRAEGYEPLILEAEPQRGNVIARHTGNGNAAPLLLYAHTDVVPAEADKWTHPPFSGAIADGYVWGRGALDMKSMVVMELMVMLLLKRNGDTLHRDVIFAATADEEDDSDVGAGWLVKHHPQLVRAEYGISESGGYTLHLKQRHYYPIMTAEKGVCWFKIRTRGQPGHGSIRHSHNAVLALAQAVDRVAVKPLPLHVTHTSREFIQRMAATLDPMTRVKLRALLNPLANRFVESRLPPGELAAGIHAMLHNTVSPSGLKAGNKVNVLPSEAEATLDGRLLPGFDCESFLAEIRPLLGTDVEIDVQQYAPPLESPIDTPLFRAMETRIRQHDPDGIVIPYMLSGATDAKFFSQLGVQCCGFTPMKLEPDEPFEQLIHAHDERISLNALAFGAQVLYETVRDFCQYMP
jgi:acetylornithine deacetylase/succinyl-diaminopimelate desuccinylase-like protein